MGHVLVVLKRRFEGSYRKPELVRRFYRQRRRAGSGREHARELRQLPPKVGTRPACGDSRTVFLRAAGGDLPSASEERPALPA